MSETTTTYIPEGGVWTAKDRAGWHAINPHSKHQSTVDALIRALDEIVEEHPAVNGEQAQRLHAASDLLAAVKS